MNVATLALLANTAVPGNESEAGMVEAESVVPMSPYAYGAIAFVILMVLLLVVTRLDLDR